MPTQKPNPQFQKIRDALKELQSNRYVIGQSQIVLERFSYSGHRNLVEQRATGQYTASFFSKIDESLSSTNKQAVFTWGNFISAVDYLCERKDPLLRLFYYK